MEFSGSDIFSFPLNPQAPSEYIPTAAITGLQFQNTPIHNHGCSSLFVYENPVHHDTYKIMMLFASHSHPFTPENRVLLTYTLLAPNPSPDTPPRFQPASAFHSVRDFFGDDAISYAGYTVQYPKAIGTVVDLRRERAVSRAEAWADTTVEDGFEVVEAAPEWEKMYFSARNGAVLGVVNGSIVVNYFK
jgi:hypothetical protein